MAVLRARRREGLEILLAKQRGNFPRTFCINA